MRAITDEDYLKFEKNMEFYTPDFGKLQDINTFLLLLKDRGHTVDDVHAYVARRTELLEQMRAARAKRDKAFRLSCPECAGNMLVYRVNATKQTQTGDSTDNSVWLCQNKDCMHTIYNKQTLEELKKEA